MDRVVILIAGSILPAPIPVEGERAADRVLKAGAAQTRTPGTPTPGLYLKGADGSMIEGLVGHGRELARSRRLR